MWALSFKNFLPPSIMMESNYHLKGKILNIIDSIEPVSIFEGDVNIYKDNNDLYLKGKNCTQATEQAKVILSWKNKVDNDISTSKKMKCDNNTVNITNLVPEYIKERVYEPTEHITNCFNTALNAAGVTLHDNNTSGLAFEDWIKSPLCTELQAEEPSQIGDIYAIGSFMKKNMGVDKIFYSHAFTYLNDYLIFEKRNSSKGPSYFSSFKHIKARRGLFEECHYRGENGVLPKKCYKVFYQRFRCFSRDKYQYQDISKEASLLFKKLKPPHYKGSVSGEKLIIPDSYNMVEMQKNIMKMVAKLPSVDRDELTNDQYLWYLMAKMVLPDFDKNLSLFCGYHPNCRKDYFIKNFKEKLELPCHDNEVLLLNECYEYNGTIIELPSSVDIQKFITWVEKRISSLDPKKISKENVTDIDVFIQYLDQIKSERQKYQKVLTLLLSDM